MVRKIGSEGCSTNDFSLRPLHIFPVELVKDVEHNMDKQYVLSARGGTKVRGCID